MWAHFPWSWWREAQHICSFIRLWFLSHPPPPADPPGPLGGAAAATCTGPCWVPDVPPKEARCVQGGRRILGRKTVG